MNYLVADFMIRIKNSAISKRKEVVLPFSNLNKEIGKVLVKEGFLENIKEETVNGKKTLNEIIKRGKRKVVLSTNKGVMTAEDAQKKGVGGEILFAIW